MIGTEEKGWLRISFSPGIGRVRLIRLMEAFPSSREALEAGPLGWRDRAGIPFQVGARLIPENDEYLQRSLAALDQIGARIITHLDAETYPPLLKEIYDPPALLFARGECDLGNCLAVVGSRRAAGAMNRFTRELCAELAGHGITIVSGAARGIDGAAHQGALDGGGGTVAVLGCGIDRVYPPEHGKLFARILETGMLLGEYPPGAEPLANHFPARNRIISGLSRGVLVVEATTHSGSLITADFALQQGREVFAVPGPVYSSSGAGVNQLLKDGATLISDSRDLLEILGASKCIKPAVGTSSPPSPPLSEKETVLWRLMVDGPRHLDEIVQRSGLTPADVSATLLHLELEGVVSRLPGMHFIANRKPSWPP
ncbi:MAG: DNA-protecting protein DprA [Desulfuromonadaceae bacterium]|nr:DNA-protecting protein DprA [Desulfuromonadaceae bacterium]